MKKTVKKVLKHPLINGSIIFIAGNFIANFFNFLFNVLMVNMLSQADFGTLAGINAIITVPSIAANSITPLIIMFAGTYFAQKQDDLIRSLYLRISKFFLIISLIFCISFFVFIPQINTFFNINNTFALILADIIIFLSLMTAINYSFIQAKLSFTFLAFLLCATTIIKLIFGWIFVISGFSVVGGIGAMLLGAIIPYFISFFPLKFIFNGKSLSVLKIDTKILFAYGIPSVLTALSLNAFIANDVILVKHFFNSESAGLYAQLSLMGRIIFFVSSPIAAVMFPLVVQQHAKKENFKGTFLLSALLVLLPSIFITAFYTIFPEFSILFIINKKEALTAVPYLATFSLYITLYSLESIIINFYLSIKKTIIVVPVIIGALLQTILIILYHQSFIEIISISLYIMLVLLIISLSFFTYAAKKT